MNSTDQNNEDTQQEQAKQDETKIEKIVSTKKKAQLFDPSVVTEYPNGQKKISVHVAQYGAFLSLIHI